MGTESAASVEDSYAWIPPLTGPELLVFEETRPLTKIFHQRDPQKALPWANPRRLSHQPCFSVAPFDLCVSLRNQKKKKVKKKAREGYISRMCRDATAWPTVVMFGIFRDLGDVINCAKFCVDRLRGFWSAGAQSWGSPIGSHHGPYHIGLH